MKPKILFVDDEQNILTSFRLSLRPMREKWDMSFALGGQEALAILAENPHEVVVSDMRMPGMDGAQLLREVRRLYPESVRIILSGFSEEESVLKAVELAHQYLGKPCRPVDLIRAIDNSLSLRDVLASRQLKSIVARLESLPTLPAIYNQLVAALSNENSTLKELGDIVSQDVSMVASILRLANSAFFGLPTRVASIHHAVNHLGGQTLRALVLGTHLFSSLKDVDQHPFSIKMLWEHSLRVACFARSITDVDGAQQSDCDDSFIAGMLHDVGKLVLATNMEKEFGQVLAMVRAKNCPVHVAEREILGATHAEVGAYLMGLWGFSSSHIETVCWHHTPQRQDSQTLSPQLSVYAANVLDHEMVRINSGYALRPFELETRDLEDTSERLKNWRSLCEQSLSEGKCHE
ncbi:MAG: HDOD domain-containing protein [Desulfovibrio sp.]|jgi:HD-like signal output (HDOD) protein|nr:HDOD domain-containing protein [Desulfovibrio sp.]MBI4961291.1 HDOD domain-containing protein [Desulfovibrio sp.]